MSIEAPVQKKNLPVPMKEIRAQLTARREVIAESLPALVDPERWINLALYAIAKEPKLQRCSIESLVRGVRESASLGLEIGSALGQAALVPYLNKRSGQYEAGFIPMYQGLLDLMFRADAGLSIACEVVYDSDEFDFIPSSAHPIRHRPALTRAPIDKRLGVYAMAWASGSRRPTAVFLRASEVEHRRKSSGATGRDSAWITHPDAMWRKTGLRELTKWTAKSIELRRALALEEEAEQEAAPPKDVTPRGEAATARDRLLDALRGPESVQGGEDIAEDQNEASAAPEGSGELQEAEDEDLAVADAAMDAALEETPEGETDGTP